MSEQQICKFCKKAKATHSVDFTKIYWEKNGEFSSGSIEKSIYLCKTCWNHAKKEIQPK